MKQHIPASATPGQAISSFVGAGLFVLAVVAQPVSALAQESGDGWQWRASIYGWLPTIDGKTQFTTGGDGPSIEVDPNQLLDNLDFTFMGALKARKGSWGFFTDVLYLDEGANKTESRDLTVGPGQLPGGIDANVNFDLKSWVWTAAGTYSLSATARHESDLYFGARMVDMKQTLNWTLNGDIGDLPLPERSGSSVVSVTNWDAVVGVTGYAFIGDEGRWVVPYLLDAGTGDSDLTWQAMAGIGYQFGWGTVALTYRYLDYDTGSDSPVTDLSFSGPLLGASFQW